MRRFYCLFFLFLFSSFLYAQDIPKAEVRLVGDAASGVYLEIDLPDGWHTYGDPAGDVGKPASLRLEPVSGIEFGGLRFPDSERIETEGIVSYGYYDSVKLGLNLRFSDSFSTEKVMISGTAKWLQCLDICVPFSEDVELRVDSEDASSAGFQIPWLVFGMAFLGGLILNLMPCVLPVISIKLLGLISHGHSRRYSMFFLLGILVSMWSLGGILAILKWQGHLLGWGFQLQSPVFVGIMAVVFFLMTLNLFSVFEIGPGLTRLAGLQGKGYGYLNAFLTGLLAVIVATPCSAPFMSVAIAYALGAGPGEMILVLSSLGLGLAAPFLLISYFPGAIRFLPKSGRWMLFFRRAMGVLMAFSVLWLLWVLSIQISGSDLTDRTWKAYSPALVQELENTGQPYFLDFTASWCLTCQVNHKRVLEREDVLAFFRDRGIVLIRADWTSEDEEITQALAQFGRRSVPTYVIFNGVRHFILGDILSFEEIKSLTK